MTNAEKIITESKKIHPLTTKQLEFIISWYRDIKNTEFGFKEVRGFKDQLRMAIDFYLKTELIWQERVLNNTTRLPFIDFFTYTAISEGIQLPTDFNKKE